MDVSESTTANVARVYDYFLGGTHNTAADRAMAGIIESRYPFIPQGVKINRWFISYVAKTWFSSRGLTHLIDLGAGLPTAGSLHECVAETTNVLYVDNDPEVVDYAQTIVADRPNVHYIQGSIEDIDSILMEVAQVFGGQRRIGINMIAVAHFIDDTQLQSIFQRLYEWSALGSILAISSTQAHPELPGWSETIEQYESQTGRKLYQREPVELQRLLAPWWWPVDEGMHGLEAYAERSLGTSLVPPAYREKVGYGGIYERSSAESNGNGSSGSARTSASSGKK